MTGSEKSETRARVCVGRRELVVLHHSCIEAGRTPPTIQLTEKTKPVLMSIEIYSDLRVIFDDRYSNVELSWAAGRFLGA